MTKSFIRTVLLSMLISLFIPFNIAAFPTSRVDAARKSSMKVLKAGKTYKKHDVTGDGKKDKIKFTVSSVDLCHCNRRYDREVGEIK